MAVDPAVLKETYQRLKKEADEGGYFLNPDASFAKELVEGLLVNEARYGYPSCPCRLASGNREEDRDIVCPCDYRDPDLSDYGCCYCGLYVSKDIYEGIKKAHSIPERRPTPEKRMEQKKETGGELGAGVKLAYPVWRCDVCGYICARENPPEICPVCKAKKDRFSRFI